MRRRFPVRFCSCAFAFLALALGGGCTNPIARLPSERDCPEFAALLDRAAKLPCETRFISVQEPGGQTLRIAFHEVQCAKPARVLVFISGVLSDSRMWRFVAPELADDYWLIMIDPPGCGQSDPAKVEGQEGTCCTYCPDWQARCILDALRIRLRDMPRDAELTLIGHSLGGAVILRMYADDDIRNSYAGVLQQVDGMVLFAPADVAMKQDVPTMRAIAESSDLVIDIGLALGIAQQKIAAGLRDGTPEPRLAFREEAERILEVLQHRSSRHAAQAMIGRAIPLRDGKPDGAEIDRIVRGYQLVNVPCLIIWGEQDRVLFPQMGHDLASSIRTSRLRYVRQGMHSLPVEYPMVSVRLIRQLVAGQFDAVARIQRIDAE